ncbi:hypothetical protein N7481_011670 [Penicillium waksmanii]|uniref:uncharacterized protein n=1 Tax=Penicillium waksmanii TaxID=69791 RepID=UPI0025491405|nr:uncharacterized protein N7481_011670 [Penicillium waksmanii]KAJ5974460.1 hypothetical protein N7481_011670 [Penicillium waksmanii]
MPSFSPSIPALTSGDSSSISSFDTNNTSSEVAGSARENDFGGPVGREPQSRHRQRQQQHQHQRQRQSIDRERVAVTVTSNISGPAGSRGSTRAVRSVTSGSHSSSAWSIAAPSISSAAPSLPATHNEDRDADINVEGDGNGNGLGHAAGGAAGIPDPRIYTCLFHMLDCHESFDDENNWTTHFVDGDPNPLSSPVPGADEEEQEVSEDEAEKRNGNTLISPSSSPRRTSIRRVDSGTDVRPDGPYTRIDNEIDLQPHQSTAWPKLLDHVAAHYRTGQTLAGSRADFELMRYLYGRRIISDAQFKAMQLAPAPSSPAYHASQDGVRASIGSSDEPYCAPYSRRREERLRGQQKGLGLVLVLGLFEGCLWLMK